MLDIRDLHFSYGDRPVLQEVSLHLGVGELVFLLGANGAGKSTLFRCVLGLLPGYEGTIALKSGDTRHLSARALAREIAYIPQNHHPTFSYPVLDMVLMGTHHQLSPFANPGPKEEAIALERNMLAPLKERADWVIDTSNLSTRALRGELLRMFSKNAAERSMEVRVMSFGFKHGIPAEADLVFDVRFLPNPYYVAELRPLTGLDAGVRDYALSSPQSQEFLKKLTDFVTYLLPRYLEEGKAALVIAVGCTGGHHRSVAVAHALAETIRGLNYPVTESHRDMGRT